MYNSLLLIFLSENPRAELLPVIFTKLVTKPTQLNHTKIRWQTFKQDKIEWEYLTNFLERK